MENRYREEDKIMGKEIAKEFGEDWLPPKPTIEIEKPDAFMDDSVIISNPRAPRRIGEVGHVMNVSTIWAGKEKDGVIHIYTVQPLGKKYRVKVQEVILID